MDEKLTARVPLGAGTAGERDTNTKIAEFVRYIATVGPNVPEIARRMGEHKETVRYWHKKLLKAGLIVQASVNFEKLGLVRVVAVADFSQEYKRYADIILTTMGELCYVQSFVKTLPDQYYIINGTVPLEHVNSWIDFMTELKKANLFSSIDFTRYEQARNVPMMSDRYDFSSGRWEFEWNAPLKVYPDVIEESGPTRPPQFDDMDLEIIKRLQRDANRSLAEIQKEIGNVNYKTLNFHHRAHVLGRRLLKGYRVNWMGNTYDVVSDRAIYRRHRYQPVDVIARELSDSEKAELRGKFNALPFLWWEATGRDNYYAQLAFPTETFPEAMLFLASALAPIRERARWFLADQAHSLWFRVEPNLYDRAKKTWSFDEAELLGTFERLLLEIGKGTRDRSSAPTQLG